MKKKVITIFILIFFFGIHNVNALEITEKGIEAYLRMEFNRSFNYYGDISAIGFIELNNRYTFRGGFSLGKAADITDFNTFISARYSPFRNLPLHFSVSYIYNNLPEYGVHTSTIVPVISFNASRAGISIGSNFRFTSFFKESAQFESILSFYGYFNIINDDILKIGTGLGNFSDFHAENLGAFSLFIYSTIQMNSRWVIVNEFEILQSGIDGFTTAFYGFAWRGGVKFTW